MKRIIGSSLVLALGCSAGDGEGEDANDDSTEDAVDERVEIPPDEPGVLNILGAEYVVEPGEDSMVCQYVTYTGDDIAFRDALSLQGTGGHHVILLGANEDHPDGTVEDCTDAADMAKYDALMIPQELPDGMGSILTAGRKMVIQSHYVNVTDSPILVRDIVQLRTVPPEEVETWAAPFVTNTVDFSIPPGQTQKVSFDCEVPEDVRLLMIGGHMHEWGRTFNIEVGPSVDQMESAYLVDPWSAEFRDTPPVTLFLSNPMEMTAGTVVRTTCEFENTEATPLEFPHEMCATFGIVAGVKDPIVCRLGEE